MNSNKAIGAMLGAGYGDALGWPNLRHDDTALNRPIELANWIRHSGGRFYYHAETINAGEHSDYFRLTLSVARALTQGSRWQERFSLIELPTWSLYERSEVGTSKKAAESWMDGVHPWHPERKPRIAKGYFDSDGDGAARRIIPHVAAAEDGKFKDIAADIMLNALVTHGHPRAMLGALSFGYALWRAFRQETTVGYGQLVEELIGAADVWAEPPAPEIMPYDWLSQHKLYQPDFLEVWKSSQTELIDRLEIAKNELNLGSQCVDSEALGRIRRLDGRLTGSGLVAAVSAIFLASRHAHSPLDGVATAAGSVGLDTVTLA